MALPVFQRTIVNDSGDIIPSPVITVTDESTGLPADLFSDRNGTTPLGTSGVFSGTSSGLARFYVAPGEYRVKAEDSGSGFSDEWRYVPVIGGAPLSAPVTGSVTFSSDVYTFTGVNPVLPELKEGLVIRFRLPSSSNSTTSPDIDYGGTSYAMKWIDGSAFDAGDLDDTYNKQPLDWYFDGTDFLLSSDLSGSNADGEWVRYVSGKQNISFSGLIDQSAQTSDAFGTTSGISYYARATFNMPKDFIDTSYTGDVTSTSTSISDGTYDSKATGSVRITLSSVDQSSTDNPFDSFFSGRWY